MHVIEQIVLCKLMLYSYMYHHSKVRAAEGLLEKMLERMVEHWRTEGLGDATILEHFLSITDGALEQNICKMCKDEHVVEYCRRLMLRLLPREVYGLSKANSSHADGALLATFLNMLQDKSCRQARIKELELAIGTELCAARQAVYKDPHQALAESGVWVDVAKPPKFEDLQDLVIGAGAGGKDLPVTQLFPIGQWQQAWTHYRYNVRIYAFSESLKFVEDAAKRAMKRIIGIESEEFYAAVRHNRE
jgi:hypothetical protein